VCICVCVCVYVCLLVYGCAGVREIGWLLSHAVPDLFVCVCVCERERERVGDRERERERKRESARVWDRERWCNMLQVVAVCC